MIDMGLGQYAIYRMSFSLVGDKNQVPIIQSWNYVVPHKKFFCLKASSCCRLIQFPHQPMEGITLFTLFWRPSIGDPRGIHNILTECSSYRWATPDSGEWCIWWGILVENDTKLWWKSKSKKKMSCLLVYWNMNQMRIAEALCYWQWLLIMEECKDKAVASLGGRVYPLAQASHRPQCLRFYQLLQIDILWTEV